MKEDQEGTMEGRDRRLRGRNRSKNVRVNMIAEAGLAKKSMQSHIRLKKKPGYETFFWLLFFCSSVSP